MKTIFTTAAALLVLATAAHADGDAAKGKKDFNKCKACHSIISPDGEKIVKGGKTGPDLWGVVGRQAGTYDDFKYSKDIVAMGEDGLVWTQDLIVEYAKDPTAFLRAHSGDDKARSPMSFKLKDASNVAAFLAQYGPDAGGDGASN
jgi:cytochrome c